MVYQFYCPHVQLIEVIGGVGQVAGVIESKPADVGLNGPDVFSVFLIRIRVVKAKETRPAEVIGNAGLMTEPRDTAQLAAAMSSVLTSPQRRKAMRRHGLMQANQFDWSKAAKKCLNIYQHILEPR